MDFLLLALFDLLMNEEGNGCSENGINLFDDEEEKCNLFYKRF